MPLRSSELESDTGAPVDKGRRVGALASPGRVTLSAVLMVLLAGCVVTRTSRPMIRGTVVDELTDEPLGGVEIWTGAEVEATSAPNGTFVLPRHTYREFTLPGREAPPLMVTFRAVKAGYCTHRYKNMSTFGGGAPDATWTLEVKLAPVRPDCDTSSSRFPPP